MSDGTVDLHLRRKSVKNERRELAVRSKIVATHRDVYSTHRSKTWQPSK